MSLQLPDERFENQSQRSVLRGCLFEVIRSQQKTLPTSTRAPNAHFWRDNDDTHRDRDDNVSLGKVEFFSPESSESSASCNTETCRFPGPPDECLHQRLHRDDVLSSETRPGHPR